VTEEYEQLAARVEQLAGRIEDMHKLIEISHYVFGCAWDAGYAAAEACRPKRSDKPLSSYLRAVK
jgi:hypothetical protein